MFQFLVDEGAITVGTLSGLFTTALLNSFKVNIIDPCIEKVVPSHVLDVVDVSGGTHTGNKSSFSSLFPIPIGQNENKTNTVIKWQTFLKDFITWLFIMIILYFVWKFYLKPLKKQ
jgi:large-conductance mechanosensitive channel